MVGLSVGQAVVTDPLLEGGSGYALTAASDSVTAEDRAHLLEMPQVSDYMHQEDAPGRFLSFHPLPSGAWAISHRFVHGKRRRAYNRVVVHTLVIPGELLAAAEDDAWLLVARCRFRVPGGKEWRLLTELAEMIREPGVREVQDLEAWPPENPRAARHEMLVLRSKRLKQQWESEKVLCGDLAQILGALEDGCSVLLPQESAMEHLLALAWSVLPRHDRLDVPWTTHLAVGGGAIFRLALTPSPAETRYQQRDPGQWVLLGEPSRRPGGGGEALAVAAVSWFESFPKVDEGLQGHGLTLAQPDVLRDWIGWVRKGGEVPPQGLANAGELEEFLKAHVSSGEKSLRRPWLSRGALLRCAALTVVRQSKSMGWNMAVQTVAGVLANRKLGWGLLDPDQIAEMIRQGTGTSEAQAAVGALGLFLATPERKMHTPSLDNLLAALESRPAKVGSLSSLAGTDSVPVFSELAAAIVQTMPEKAVAVYRVVHRNGGLEATLDFLKPPLGQPHLVRLRAILRVLQDAGDHTLAGRVAADFLVPLLGKYPAQASIGDLGAMVLEALQAAPRGLVQAFSEWNDPELYSSAAQTLRNWAEKGMEAVPGVAEKLAEDTRTPSPVREWASILGLSRALASAGAPPKHWLVFALAEAAVLDSPKNQEGLRFFREFLSKAQVGGSGLEKALKKLLNRFDPNHPGPPLGPAHRALVICLAGSLSRHRAAVTAALAKLSELHGADLLLWGEAVSAVANQVSGADAKTASQISRNWWTGLVVADVKLEVFPWGALNLLDLLSAQDAAAVLEHWAPRMPSLGPHARVKPLLETFESLARRHELSDHSFLCEVGRLAWQVRHEKAALEPAISEVVRKGPTFGQKPAQIASAVARLLPYQSQEFTKIILMLLVSSSVPPLTKVFLQENFLDKALEPVAVWALTDVLPPFEALAERNSLLLAVARRMGRAWAQLPEEQIGAFVSWLLEHERYDALGSFVVAAEEKPGEKSFLATMKARNPPLFEGLVRAAEHRVGRWDMARVKGLKSKKGDKRL